MPRTLRAAVLCTVAMLIAMPSEAKPRDPVGQFFAGIGKAFEPQKRLGPKRQKPKVYSAAKVRKEITSLRSTERDIPEITVRPVPKDLDRYAPAGTTVSGLASYYGEGFHGRTTYCRAITDDAGNKWTSVFNMHRLSMASRTLRCGTMVQVFREGYAPIIVTVTDKGPCDTSISPCRGNRIADLSYGAAQQLGLIKPGVARVTLRVLGKE